jgi:hypothetical protein
MLFVWRLQLTTCTPSANVKKAVPSLADVYMALAADNLYT